MLSFQLRGAASDPRSSIHTLLLSGEADLAVVDELIDRGTATLAQARTSTLVIDLHDVSFIDCAALGALVQLRNVAASAGKRLYLSYPSARVQTVLDLAGLRFDVVGDVRAVEPL